MSVPTIAQTLAAAYAGGYDQGNQMYTFYPDADRVFPILPDDFEVLTDTPAGSYGLAWYFGLNPLGQPRFAVRDDVYLNSKIAWHESGHAFEDVVTREYAKQTGMGLDAAIDRFRTAYWKYRGFELHGTWQDANAQASANHDWAMYPMESVAEAFSAAVGGYVQSEWTANYGKPLYYPTADFVYDPTGGGIRARAFFTEFMNEVDMTEEQIRAIAAAAAQEAVVRSGLDPSTVGFIKDRLAKDAHHRHNMTLNNGASGVTGEPVV